MLSVSPGLTQYYTPLCSDDIKPHINQVFESLDHGYFFYLLYGNHCGFNVRKSTLIKASDGSGVAVWRYFACSKEGYKLKDDPETSKRRRTIDRCGCPAMIAFRLNGKHGYVANIFEERHTHSMGPVDHKYFLKNNR